MKVNELGGKLWNMSTKAGNDALVMVIVADGGKIYDLRDVVVEHHDEGEGAPTVWIKVEET